MLLRAAVLQVASAAIRTKINPYTICFPNQASRSFISAKLGLDTDYVVAAPPTASSGLRNEQMLRTTAAWLVSRSCTEADVEASPLAAYIADRVTIVAREGLPADNKVQQLALSEPDREVTRGDFLRATCGAFAFWNSLSSKEGRLQVNETASKGGWLVTGSMLDGRLTTFRIVPAS
jgi:hypothetical protein